MEEVALDIIVPVIEAAMIYATHYCRACGRATVTAKDVEYGMKHAAMTTVGKHLGTHFPEDEDSDTSLDSDEEQDSDESLDVDDEEEPFTRYTDTDETCLKMNASFDTWDTWEPQSPAEQAIKNAVDKQKEDGRVHTG
jgi:hypothetical protein